MFATNSINNKPRSINNNKYNNLINNEIKFKEFTLIDSDGQNLGITKRDVALRLAQDKNLDLVLISNKVPNVVCKIMDYGKYVYDQQRKAKDNKKNQKKIKVKEVKVKPTIGDNDLS
ncbi:translation initiation factor IF-3 [bacterium]|nr:translation initiation factor IF-3 [bacterium]